MNPASQNTPFGRLAKGPANGSQPAHSGRSARPHPHSLDHPRTEPVGAGMDPARQRRPAAVPARTAGRPALRHLGLPPRGPSHRRGHHLRRRPGDRNLQPVRRRASGRAAVAQRPAGGCRTPAGPAHRRLRARHRPGICPASRMPGPRTAPRLGARSRDDSTPEQPAGRTPQASPTAGRFTEAIAGSAAKSQRGGHFGLCHRRIRSDPLQWRARASPRADHLDLCGNTFDRWPPLEIQNGGSRSC